MAFDKKDICEKIKIENENKDSNVINIPVILYLNIMRIISNINNEKGLTIKDYVENEEDLITKSFLELKIKHYLSKVLKLKTSNCKDKKIIISTFSQNRELSSLNEDVADSKKAIKSN